MSNTKIDSSLIGWDARQTPPWGPRNQPDTVHCVPMLAGNLSPITTLAQADEFALLTFTQDMPIIWEVRNEFWGVSTPAPPPSVWQYSHQVAISGDCNLVANSLYTPNAGYTVINPYTQGQGLSTTNSVPVKGYLGFFSIPDYGLIDDGSPATATGFITCMCQAPQMYGTPQMAATSTLAIPAVYGGAYLLETAYTQAMQDAGNQIFVAGGALRIVGLWNYAGAR